MRHDMSRPVARTVERVHVGPTRVLVTVLALLIATAVSAFAPPRSAWPVTTGWDEQFASTTLDPAWSVYPGQRTYYPSFFPPNTMTLTGTALRYGLEPMTHMDGYLNGNQLMNDGGNTYDPGLSLTRAVTGAYWVMEAKADYYMPFSNGRGQTLRVYFGDGSTGTVYAGFTRFRDGPWGPNISQDSVWLQLQQKTGTAYVSYPTTSAVEPTVYVAPTAGDAYYYRLARAGGVLTASWSADGTSWTQAWTHDFGTALDGLDQNVVIAGHSWASPASSYADYDYVTVTPSDTTPPVLTTPTSPVTADATSPAGAVVTYVVTALDAVDGAVVPTCAPASGSTFALGDTTVSCTATDQAGNTSAPATFTVHVAGAAEQLATLQALVDSYDLPSRTAASLTSKLDRVLAYLAAGKTAQAVSTLDSFVAQVTSLGGNKKYAAVAPPLLAAASQIRTVIG